MDPMRIRMVLMRMLSRSLLCLVLLAAACGGEPDAGPPGR